MYILYDDMTILKRGMPYKGETDPTKITWSFLHSLCAEHIEHLFKVNNIPIPENTDGVMGRKHWLFTQFLNVIKEAKLNRE